MKGTKGSTPLDTLLLDVESGGRDLEADLCVLEELRVVQQTVTKGIARQRASLVQQCVQKHLWHLFDLNESKLRRHVQDQR